jgi:hypothetical protein
MANGEWRRVAGYTVNWGLAAVGAGRVTGCACHMRPHFRFEDLEIWKLAADLALEFHALAGRLHERRLYRYAEQLRAAGLSLPNMSIPKLPSRLRGFA